MQDTLIQEISGLRFVVNVDGVFKTFDLGKIFTIDEENLAKEFANQAALYAYFATLSAKADHVASMKKLSKEQERAEADQDYRTQLSGRDKKVTEGTIKSMVDTDEKVSQLSKEELDAELDADILKAITRALEERGRMLMSLGSHLRHELDMTGMNVREREFENSKSKMENLLRTKHHRS